MRLLTPLVIATAAVSWRQATRAAPVPSQAQFEAEEYVPPARFLLAARAPGMEQTLTVSSDDSRAVVWSGDASAEHAQLDARVEGTIAIDASESALTLDLTFTSSVGPITLSLRGESSACRAMQAPGTHACEMRARSTSASLEREGSISVCWLRLPGGSIRLQGVFDADEPQADRRRASLLGEFRRGQEGRIAFDLTLKPRR